MTVSVPIKYFGGKGNMYKTVLSYFPPKEDYSIYIEPFGGSFCLGLKKPESEIEIYNDLDQNVYSLYKVLSDKELFNTFKERCDLTIYSEDLRQEYKTLLKSKDISILDRAFYYFYVNRTSVNGVGGISLNFNCIRRGMSKSISDMLSSVDGLPEIHNRLSKVFVLNRDALMILDKFKDSESVFTYCIPEGILIYQDGSYKPIEKVIENKTNLGNGNLCLKKHIRETVDEEIIKLNVRGISRHFDIKMSKDHVVFIYENNEIKEIKAEELKKGDSLLVDYEKTKIDNYIPDLPESNNKRKQIILNKNLNMLAELLGFYTAEGHMRDGLFFSFNINELKYHERVKYLIKELFNVDAKICPNSPHPTVTQVKILSRTIEEYFSLLITGHALDKKLSNFVMSWDNEALLELLKSWLKGDGGFVKSERNRNRITGTTASKELAYQMYNIAIKCGLTPSIRCRESINKLKNNIKFVCYDIRFSTNKDISLLTGLIQTGIDRNGRKHIENYMVTKIDGITTEKFTGKMYDLTTTQGKFRMFGNILVHNCDPPYEWSTRTNARYSVDMNPKQHQKLLDLLLTTKNKVLISGYDSNTYDILEQSGTFNKIKFEVNTIDAKRKPKTKTEVLWKNY